MGYSGTLTRNDIMQPAENASAQILISQHPLIAVSAMSAVRASGMATKTTGAAIITLRFEETNVSA